MATVDKLSGPRKAVKRLMVDVIDEDPRNTRLHLAADLYLSLGRIRQKLDTESRASLAVHEISVFHRLFGDALIQWVCQQCGGVFVPLPPEQQDVQRRELFSQLSRLVRSLGPVGQRVEEALDEDSDGGQDITAAECKQIEEALDGVAVEALGLKEAVRRASQGRS